MQIAQYEMTLLYHQLKRRQDQEWYAQWEDQHDEERQPSLLRRFVKRLRTTPKQTQPVGDARHAHAI
jgi:hypothetical protein